MRRLAQAVMAAMYGSTRVSLQLALFMTDTACEVSARLLEAAWRKWVAPGRATRHLAMLGKAGALALEADPAKAAAERVVRLTESGRLAALGGRDPEARWSRAWDGAWRIVVFDVAEQHRSARIRLTRQLRRAHFGYLQDSVWITPDSIADLELAKDEGSDLAGLSFLEARPCSGATDADLVRGAWDFTAINNGYASHAEVLRNAPGAQASLEQRRTWLSTEWNAWSRALRDDPLLPEPLLPKNYRGRRAWEARADRLRRLLAGG